MSDSGLEGRVAIVTGRGLGVGICSARALAGAAVASDATSFIIWRALEIDGGWATH